MALNNTVLTIWLRRGVRSAVRHLERPRFQVLAIAISVTVLGLLSVVLMLGGWVPWAPEDLSTRAAIAGPILGLLALIGIVLSLIGGGFETLFIRESRDVMHKFGAITFDGPGEADVYEHGATTADYPFQPLATKLDVLCEDNDDKYGCHGANTIVIKGLDQEYKDLDEEVKLTGNSTTTKSFLRMNRAFVKEVGNRRTNVGKITFRVKGQQDVLGTIGPLNGQTLQCIYTVPTGKVLLMRGWSISVSDQVRVKSTLFHREYKSGWRIRDRHYSSASGLISHNFPDDSPVPFSQKSDIRIHVQVGGASSVSAEFSGILRPKRGSVRESDLPPD